MLLYLFVPAGKAVAYTYSVPMLSSSMAAAGRQSLVPIAAPSITRPQLCRKQVSGAHQTIPCAARLLLQHSIAVVVGELLTGKVSSGNVAWGATFLCAMLAVARSKLRLRSVRAMMLCLDLPFRLLLCPHKAFYKAACQVEMLIFMNLPCYWKLRTPVASTSNQ